MIDIRVPQTGTTFYGDKIVSFRDMFNKTNIEQAIRIGLHSIFEKIGLSEELLSDTVNHCTDSVKHYSNLLDYEYSTHNFLEQKGILNKYRISKKSRASIRTKKVEQYLIGRIVLDLGCGSGKVGLALKNKGYKVTLADVYRNHHALASGLPFYQVADSQPLPFSNNSFENVLILSMLHHTQNPLQTIDECRRILKKNGRLHLIETVYGISVKNNGGYGTDDSSFKSLSNEQQRLVTMFFDYFANHILDGYTEDRDKYIPVPFNFTTPDNLEQIFRKNGYELISKEDLGIYPFSYVYHIHFVYGKT